MKVCPEHPKRFLLPIGKGLWEVSHFGCDYPTGGCDCYCGADCDKKYQGTVRDRRGKKREVEP